MHGICHTNRFASVVTSVLDNVLCIVAYHSAHRLNLKLKMKKVLYISCLLFVHIAHALPIDSLTARRWAMTHLQKTAAKALFPSRAVNSNEDLRMIAADKGSYLFVTQNGEFVLTAADDKLPQILGYGPAAKGNIPPAVSCFRETIKHCTSHSTKGNEKYVPVTPLLTAVRHQGAPYNNYCPYYTHDDGTQSKERCVVGCVATALEEIISYYRKELVLVDTLPGWSTPHYQIDTLFPGERVDCSLIRDNYDAMDCSPEEIHAVAKLSLMCGMAAQMNWGLSESGARVSRLVTPLRKAFGFPYVHHADSYQYSPEDWTEMLRNEIYARRPVLYAGYTMSMSGHAFVLDGIDEDGFFHVNWGYGGDYDGYFRIDVLNFSEPKSDNSDNGEYMGFYCNQEALLLSRDEVQNVLPDTLARTGYEIQITQVTPMFPPETNKKTPLQITFKNTSSHTLTTPFEYFTHAPTDTMRFEGADFVALSGITLAPGEQQTKIIHADFNEKGERILCISPDDVAILHEVPIHVADGKSPNLIFERPLIQFLDDKTTQVNIRVENLSSTQRSGQNLVAELIEGIYDGTQQGVRHYHPIYVLPQSTDTLSFQFRELTYGRTYTLLLRSPWAIRHTVTFTQGIDTKIVSNTLSKEDRAYKYTIDGRLLSQPNHRGVVIVNGEKYLRKK